MAVVLVSHAHGIFPHVVVHAEEGGPDILVLEAEANVLRLPKLAARVIIYAAANLDEGRHAGLPLVSMAEDDRGTDSMQCGWGLPSGGCCSECDCMIKRRSKCWLPLRFRRT